MNNTKRYKKAFTLAELMVIMSVMTIILAAVAPIFTSRYSNVSFDNVWSLVAADNNNSIYSDAPTRAAMQESLIGITPFDMEDIRSTYQPYSKVIIRSSDRVNNNIKQKQIEFRYNDSTTGYLFAGNYNLLLGGNYNSINFLYNKVARSSSSNFVADTNNAIGNTALGHNALNNITSGKYNSALGYNSLSSLTTGSANTAAGVNSGSSLTSGDGNVLIGYHSYDASSGEYNTIVGHNSSTKSSHSEYTTAIGNEINVKGNYNVAIGNYSNAGGSYNTAVGYSALSSANPSTDSYNSFGYNTAIGYKSCSGIGSSAKYTTCIGGSGVDENIMSSTARSLYSNSDRNKVLIGSSVPKYASAATLEVYNINSADSNSKPYPNLGNSSVIVNGNLIVRGQTYMAGRSPFPIVTTSNSNADTISLMGYKLYTETESSHKPLIGLDGSGRTVNVKDDDGYIRQKFAGREHCICTYSCPGDKKGRDSYDWSYFNFQRYEHVYDGEKGENNYLWGHNPHICGSDYNDTEASSNSIELDAAHNLTSGVTGDSATEYLKGGSCCPILTPSGRRNSDDLDGILSDKNAKNLISEYKNSLSDLLKIKIFNYIFKFDKDKSPHTGVIAQDLKQVFPNSVTKDENGYFKIRWDEMFYAAINSVKELNQKIIKISENIENNISRINSLKKDNQKLEKRLIELSKELEELEK